MEFDKLLVQRRSVRAYSAKPVRNEDLEAMVRAAQYAPSWKNSQTARTYIVNTPESLAKVRAALPEFNQRSCANAALLVTTFVKNISGFGGGEPTNEVGNEWGAYDLGLMNAYMILKAADLGIDTLIMGIRDGDALRKAVGIGEDEEVMAVIAAGYREGEPVFKPRKPMDEVAKFI